MVLILILLGNNYDSLAEAAFHKNNYDSFMEVLINLHRKNYDFSLEFSISRRWL